MAPVGALKRFSNDERVYLYARVTLLFLLALLYQLNLLSSEELLHVQAFLIATAVFAIGTIVVFAMVLPEPGRFKVALAVVLPTDLVAVCMLTLVGARSDAFYPVCILIPVMYALLVRKREAWLVGAATAIAYVLGHVIVGGITASGFAILVVKAISIPLICIIVADSVDKQRQREEEACQTAAERDELNERLQRRVAELRTLSQITEIMHASLDLDEAGPLVLNILSKAIGVESCGLFVVDRSGVETVFSASVGPGMEPVSVAPEVGEIEGPGDEPHVCISVFEDPRGSVLFCASADDAQALSEEDLIVLGAVASELIVAAENSGLFKLAQRMAITDDLTGLYNYRHLQERLDQEVGRALRYRRSVSMIMIDVDHFKGFNDTHGHRAGDVALGDVAEVLRGAVREIDVVARYGGEEFAVILPETDQAGAAVVAEKVRKAVETYLFADDAGVRCCQLTVSIGLATLPEHASDKESLLRESDDALYHAKHGGKNRVKTPGDKARESVARVRPDDPTGA